MLTRDELGRPRSIVSGPGRSSADPLLISRVYRAAPIDISFIRGSSSEHTERQECRRAIHPRNMSDKIGNGDVPKAPPHRVPLSYLFATDCLSISRPVSLFSSSPSFSRFFPFSLSFVAPESRSQRFNSRRPTRALASRSVSR